MQLVFKLKKKTTTLAIKVIVHFTKASSKKVNRLWGEIICVCGVLMKAAMREQRNWHEISELLIFFLLGGLSKDITQWDYAFTPVKNKQTAKEKPNSKQNNTKLCLCPLSTTRH